MNNQQTQIQLVPYTACREAYMTVTDHHRQTKKKFTNHDNIIESKYS